MLLLLSPLLPPLPLPPRAEQECDFAMFTEDEHRRAKNRAAANPLGFQMDEKRAAIFEEAKKAKLTSPFGFGRDRDTVLYEPLPMAELVRFRAAAGAQYVFVHATH